MQGGSFNLMPIAVSTFGEQDAFELRLRLNPKGKMVITQAFKERYYLGLIRTEGPRKD
jgi:hypothetical protein